MKDIGERFQQETKYDPGKIGGHSLDFRRRPEPFKYYEDPLSVMTLPKPDLSGEPGLWSLLLQRRSRRNFDDSRPLGLELLSSLLWAAQGITSGHGNHLFRTAPSAGALYPVETYLSVRAVEGLEHGLYHFRPRHFDLEFLQNGDLSKEFAKAALGQTMVMKAQVTFLWSALVERAKWKYEQRAYRYIYLDAGHIAQNLYLAGEALDLGVCAIAAFFDDEVNRLIGLDGIEETILYMAAVGWTKK